ncbi:MAG: heme o synthase [Bryobacteraceae bacterium]|nr:heme o synthase [Bryobacteraceae bacterium]
MKPYIDLTKPRITWLILMSTGIGYVFGTQGGANWLLLLHTLLGTALIASGTATFNQWYEHRADALMNRTKGRPIPSGLVTPKQAFAWGLLLSVAGFAELWLGANPLTALAGLFTLVTYLFLYTPMKQQHWHATTIGAVPGAMPPVIGYAAASGVINWEAAALFAVLFVWQFPHFYAIAWMYRDDYAKASIKMLPVVEPDGDSTARQILFFSLLLIPVSFVPTWLHMTGTLYLVGAAILGVYFLRAAVRVVRNRTIPLARGVLLTSVIYLPVLYGLMLLDRQ